MQDKYPLGAVHPEITAESVAAGLQERKRARKLAKDKAFAVQARFAFLLKRIREGETEFREFDSILTPSGFLKFEPHEIALYASELDARGFNVVGGEHLLRVTTGAVK